MTTAALGQEAMLGEQRVTQLDADAHTLALWIVALDQTARAHRFHGRWELSDATLIRRESLVNQRSLMLHELVLERLMRRPRRS